ncbi:hypothetical protein STSP2_00491 [Anaerohalosphaera lusitana]|uniref:Glycosyltransferase RgtA/B/C/D-like domain-containing protein n=1 Tax=Anaerohalosphaera lusitana TaxID=1936003 RepID=A0A1U9NHV8_9BACT|nr:hypothetical protein [Anaerohalosphaera lusitana]AQT67347.1 hypothetical protein STSP2_00491 [Anaerohalosphaera lusitana]
MGVNSRKKLGRNCAQSAPANTGPLSVSPDLRSRRELFGKITLASLTVFAATLAVLYFGYQPVPNSDFPAFISTAENILSLEAPSFKRTPGLGIAQILLSNFMPGPHPQLTAGWMLNTLLYIATAPLLYLVGRRVIGRAAPLLVILVLINPWSLYMLTQPIVETSLVFFLVLTFFLILKPSRWTYLTAAIASMFRYEAAVLIFIMLAVDLVRNKQLRERFWAVAFAGLASLPMIVWLLAMFVIRPGNSSLAENTYFDGYLAAGTSFATFADYIWQTAAAPLFMGTSGPACASITVVSKIVLATSLFGALTFAVYRKNWRTLALAAFLIVYYFLHASRSFTVDRYAVPVLWLTLLLAFKGAADTVTTLKQRLTIPAVIPVALLILTSIVCTMWALTLLRRLPSWPCFTAISAWTSAITAIVAVGLAITRIALTRCRILAHVAVLTVLAVVIVSNQIALCTVLGDGKTDYEFKLLADWYREKAPQNAKLATTMPHLLAIFAPDSEQDFVPTRRIPGDILNEFTQNALRRGITYVAWDSRMGLYPGDKYYQRWNMQKIAPLKVARDRASYEFITQLKTDAHNYINIFRLTADENTNQNAQTARTE